MARIVYRLIKHGEAYVAAGAEREEEKYRDRRLRMLKQHAAELGFDLTERPNKNPVS